MLVAAMLRYGGAMPLASLYTDRLQTFLAEHVLSRYPAQLQQFMVGTAVLDELPLDRCNALFEDDSATPRC